MAAESKTPDIRDLKITELFQKEKPEKLDNGNAVRERPEPGPDFAKIKKTIYGEDST